MDRTEQDAAEGILREYLESLPHEALTRVVTAERWCAGGFTDGSSRCLCGHAEDWGNDAPSQLTFAHQQLRRFSTTVEDAFDDLCAGRGIAYVVALVQSKAAVLLHDREEAVVVALLQPAFCPLAAREESLT